MGLFLLGVVVGVALQGIGAALLDVRELARARRVSFWSQLGEFLDVRGGWGRNVCSVCNLPDDGKPCRGPTLSWTIGTTPHRRGRGGRS